MKRMMWSVGLVCGTALLAAAAHAGGIDGTGTVGSCTITGSIKLKPALTNGNSAPGAVKVKAKSITCSGGTMDGATVASLKGKGTATTTNSDCASLVGTQPSTLTLSVKWKSAPGGPKLNPSTIAFTSQTGGLTMDGMHGTFLVTGSVTAGSFNGNPVTVSVQTDQTTTDLATACAGKGVKKITFGLPGGSAAASL